MTTVCEIESKIHQSRLALKNFCLFSYTFSSTILSIHKFLLISCFVLLWQNVVLEKLLVELAQRQFRQVTYVSAYQQSASMVCCPVWAKWDLEVQRVRTSMYPIWANMGPTWVFCKKAHVLLFSRSVWSKRTKLLWGLCRHPPLSAVWNKCGFCAAHIAPQFIHSYPLWAHTWVVISEISLFTYLNNRSYNPLQFGKFVAGDSSAKVDEVCMSSFQTLATGCFFFSHREAIPYSTLYLGGVAKYMYMCLFG